MAKNRGTLQAITRKKTSPKYTPLLAIISRAYILTKGNIPRDIIKPVIPEAKGHTSLIPEDGVIYAFPVGFFFPLVMATCMHQPNACVGTYTMYMHAMNNTFHLVAVSCSEWSD